MNFEVYRFIVKPVTKRCLNVSGILFTFISAVIFCIFEANNSSGSILDPIIAFIICFLLGNAFGVFIVILATYVAYRKVKSDRRLYESLLYEVKKKYDLALSLKPITTKYEYPQLQINSTKRFIPLLFFNLLKFPDRVRIIVAIYWDDIDFQKSKYIIHKKYGKSRINLTVWGLRRIISWKK